MSTFSLSAVEPDDWREVAALVADPDVAALFGGLPYDPPERWRARLADPDPARGVRIAARAAGAIIGLIGLDVMAPPRARHVGRLYMAVAPAWQGRGVGRRLLAAAIDVADRWYGLLRLELPVHEENTRAVALYQKLGFEIEARSPGHMLARGVPSVSLLMGRMRPGFVPAPPAAPPPAWPAPRAPSGEVRLRAASPDDAAAIAALFADPGVLWGVAQPPFPTAAAWRRRLETNGPEHHTLIAEVGGRVAGMGGLHGFANPRLAHVYELGMVIGAASQGQGVGGVVLRGLLELADRWLGARRVGLAVYADNARAVRLYERHGFVHEGRLRCDRLRDGDYVDSLVMGRVRP